MVAKLYRSSHSYDDIYIFKNNQYSAPNFTRVIRFTSTPWFLENDFLLFEADTKTLVKLLALIYG